MNIKYDFHIHSCLSPCAENDMTPNNIVNMAHLCGLSAIAVTDHNSCGNCEAVIKLAEKAGITALAGMELTTSEEVHVLCLFKSINEAISFERTIKKPKIKNKPRIFGTQFFMDENDEILGIEDALLFKASDISVNEVFSIAKSYGGIAIPAHIDRGSFSIISTLGFIPDDLGITTVEYSEDCDYNSFKKSYAYLDKYLDIINSDAHSLEYIGGNCMHMEVSDNSPASIIDKLYKNLEK